MVGGNMITVIVMLSVYCQRWLPEALLISPIACVLRCSVSYNLRPCGDRRRRANAVSCVTIHVAAPVDCTVGITVPYNSLNAPVCPIVLTLQDTCADCHALPCLASPSRCTLILVVFYCPPASCMHVSCSHMSNYVYLLVLQARLARCFMLFWRAS